MDCSSSIFCFCGFGNITRFGVIHWGDFVLTHKLMVYGDGSVYKVAIAVLIIGVLIALVVNSYHYLQQADCFAAERN